MEAFFVILVLIILKCKSAVLVTSVQMELIVNALVQLAHLMVSLTIFLGSYFRTLSYLLTFILSEN